VTPFVIYDAAAQAAFTPSKPFLIVAERVTLDWFFDKTAGVSTAKVEWFLEFTSDDPLSVAARWAREVAEEDIGNGVTHMPPVVRDFADIPTGQTKRSTQFVRSHQFVRVQIKLALTSPDLLQRVTVQTPFGSQVLVP